MTLDEARTLRPGDVIVNRNLPEYASLIVSGPVIRQYGEDCIQAWVDDVDGGHTVPSFVSLSHLVRRALPVHLHLPAGA